MAKSKETFSKKENEKKRLKLRQEKQEKKEERKANAKKGQSLEDMLAYVDDDGNITSTPPDKSKRKVFAVEDIQLGVPKQEEQAPGEPNEGVVSYFNDAKGFGFIIDKQRGERLFFHINSIREELRENDRVTYTIEKNFKGLSAVNITKLP